MQLYATELMGAEQVADPCAMPLQEFIDETLQVLGTDAHEVLTERVPSSVTVPGQMTRRPQNR